MKACLTQVFAGVFALTALSLLGCSSETGGSPPSSGGSTGGATTASSDSVSSGGASTSPTSSGGALPGGGTPASGGQSQIGSVSQGGSATGGAVTSAAGQPATGGKASGGAASGGSATGGSATGGSATGGSATGGSVAGGSTPDAGVMGGSTTGDAAAGGKTTAGGSTGAPDGAATGGKTTADGAASAGTATGGTTATGGSPPVGGGLGSSDGKTPIKVWMSGDSTMSGGTSCSSCPCGWGTQFASVFNSNVTIVNSAISGRSIKTWLYDTNVSTKADATGECILTGTTYSAEWNAMLDANTGMKRGDYLIIEFGINDGSDCSKARHVGIELFKTYLTTMAKAASDRGAQAIFLTPTNMIACSGSTAQTNTRGQYPAATIAAGTAANVPVIDVTTLSAALYTSAGLCPNSGSYTSGAVGAFFCNDHTHFEKAGALQIAQIVGKALKDQGIGLASYLAN